MPTNMNSQSGVVAVRLPHDLLAQATQVAAQRGCSLSQLLRGGLMLICAASTPVGQASNTLTLEAIRQVLREELQAVLAHRPTPVQQVRPTPVQQPASHAPGAPGGYDTTKFYLGKLCRRGHEYQQTGQSLLRKGNNGCPQCLNALKREQRAARKASA